MGSPLRSSFCKSAPLALLFLFAGQLPGSFVPPGSCRGALPTRLVSATVTAPPPRPAPVGEERSWVSALSICAGALLAIAAFAGKAWAASVDVYFGSGSFSHLQHEFVLKEALDLGRRAEDITAVAGYAGGTRVGDLDRVCYSGFAGSPDYAALGHAQVVRLSLPSSRVADFARVFFDEVQQRKSFERRAHFRPLVGLRGGFKSPELAGIEEGNGGRVRLVKGSGDEKDAEDGVVYVYDAKKFPFRPAELSCQFANYLPEVFTKDYRQLNQTLKAVGGISTTGCPEMRLQ